MFAFHLRDSVSVLWDAVRHATFDAINIVSHSAASAGYAGRVRLLAACTFSRWPDMLFSGASSRDCFALAYEVVIAAPFCFPHILRILRGVPIVCGCGGCHWSSLPPAANSNASSYATPSALALFFFLPCVNPGLSWYHYLLLAAQACDYFKGGFPHFE